MRSTAMQTKQLGKIVWEWTAITVATAIVASAVYFFLIPSQVPVGSVSSLAMVLGTVIPLPISAITMILNVLLLLLDSYLSAGSLEPRQSILPC